MPLRPDMGYRDYLEVLVRRKWLIAVSFVAVSLGTGAYLIGTPPLYKSTTTILVIPKQDVIRSSSRGGVEDRLATIEQQITSRTRLMQVREELGLFPAQGEKQIQEEVYEKMKKRIEIEVLEDPSVNRGRGGGSKEGFSLSYLDKNPKLAMLAANRIASLFIEESLKTRERQAVGTSNLIKSQLKEMKSNLEIQEEKIKRYKIQHLGELPQELQSNLSNLARLQDQYKVKTDEIRASENKKFQLQYQISMIERGTRTIVSQDGREEVDTSHDYTQVLITELNNRRNQLAELNAKYTNRHPDVIRLSQEVAQMEKKLAAAPISSPTSNDTEQSGSSERTYLPLPGREREEILNLRAQVKSTGAEIDVLKKDREKILRNIDLLQEKVNRVPRHEQELMTLTRDYDNLKIAHNDLLKRSLEANITEDMEDGQKAEQFQILDPANFPEKPFKPDKMRVLFLAFLLASGLGFGGAIVLEGADQTLRGVKDFQHFFDLKVFACIPEIDEGGVSRRKFFQQRAVLGGVLLFLSGVLAFLWFYGEQVRIILNG